MFRWIRNLCPVKNIKRKLPAGGVATVIATFSNDTIIVSSDVVACV